MALQGTLDTFALPDVLRLLAATTKTGRLQIDGDRGAGEVWIDGGRIVGGNVDALTNGSDDVLFELLRHDHGSFEFVAEDTAPEGHEPLEADEVIEQAEAKLAEWRTVESVVPSLTCWVGLAEELPHDEVVIGRDRWQLLVSIGEGRTVADLDVRLELGEIAVSKVVKGLADDGLIVVGEPVAISDEPAEVDDLPMEFDEVDDIVFTHDEVDGDDPDATVHSVMADPMPDEGDPTDLDEIVRAEIDTAHQSAGDGSDGGADELGGSRDVDLDSTLDVGAADHAYLTASSDDGAVEYAALGSLYGTSMPEPLPLGAADGPAPEPVPTAVGAEVGSDPFVHPAATEPDQDDWSEPSLPVTPDADASSPERGDEVEVARHLNQLSPKAARAIAAAAAAPEQEGGNGKAKKNKGGKTEEPMNRTLLMKFISSK